MEIAVRMFPVNETANTAENNNDFFIIDMFNLINIFIPIYYLL